MHIDLSTVRIPFELTVTMRSGRAVRCLSPLDARDPRPPRDTGTRAALTAEAEAIVDHRDHAEIAAASIGELLALKCAYEQAAALWWGAYSAAVAQRIGPGAVTMLGLDLPAAAAERELERDSTHHEPAVERPSNPSGGGGARSTTHNSTIRLRPGGGHLPAVLGGGAYGAARPPEAEPEPLLPVRDVEPEEVAAAS